MADDVVIKLSRDEALVLFEWIAAFNSKSDTAFVDRSEERALWDLEAQLETALPEPFSADYDQRLSAARARVRDSVHEGKLEKVTDFLERLDEAKIAFHLASSRPNATMVCATVPGERWEVEFLTDGSVEVEVFRSDGAIADGSALAELFARFTD